MKITSSLSDEAFAAYSEVRKYKNIGNYSAIQLGKSLLDIQKRKLYKAMGHPTLASFLADPDVAIPRPTAYLYKSLVDFYLNHLGVEEDDIIEVDITRLRDLLPVLRPCEKGAPMIEQWIAKAATLSKKDFVDELREHFGREPLGTLPAMEDADETISETPYVSRAKVAACCVCGNRPVDFHHFPKTKGAGAEDERGIPLCRGCHIQFHAHPKDFFWMNRNNIMEWFYKLILPGSNNERNA